MVQQLEDFMKTSKQVLGPLIFWLRWEPWGRMIGIEFLSAVQQKKDELDEARRLRGASGLLHCARIGMDESQTRV